MIYFSQYKDGSSIMEKVNTVKEIAVVEIIQAAIGKTKELRKALHELASICRRGEGCLQYEVFEPMRGTGEFLVLMRWKDPQDLIRHEKSLPIQEFVQKYDKILYGEVRQTEWIPI
jgi:quinol monooxygenase YgiN